MFNVVNAANVELASGTSLTLNSNLSVGGTVQSNGAFTALGTSGSVRLGAADATQTNFFLSGGDTYLDYNGIFRLRTVAGSYAQVMFVNHGGTPADQVVWGFPMSGNSGTALRPGYAFSSETSLGWYNSGASTMALSYGTLNLNQVRLVSIRTQGSLDSTTLAQGELAISIAVASGASLALRSGNTIYYWTSSASTKG